MPLTRKIMNAKEEVEKKIREAEKEMMEEEEERIRQREQQTSRGKVQTPIRRFFRTQSREERGGWEIEEEKIQSDKPQKLKVQHLLPSREEPRRSTSPSARTTCQRSRRRWW